MRTHERAVMVCLAGFAWLGANAEEPPAAPPPAQGHEPFRIHDILIEGNDKTVREAILAETWLTPGQTATMEDVRRGAQQVMNLGYFTSVALDTKPAGGETDVHLKVAERQTWGINPIVSIEGDDNSFGLELSESNLFGYGKSGGVSFSAGDDQWSASASYFDRHLAWTRWYWGAGAFAQNARIEGIDPTGGLAFENEADTVGANVFAGYWIAYELRAQLGLSTRDDEFSLKKGTFVFDDGTTHKATLGAVYERVDFYLTHYRGGRIGAFTEKGFDSAGGDFDFTRTYADGSLFLNPLERWVPDWERHTLFLAGFWGTANDAPGHELYALGGRGSIRGYPRGFQIGEEAVILTAEYRVPVWEPRLWDRSGVVTVLGFVDTGTAADAIRGGDFITGAGGGIRLYVNEIASARLGIDVGYGFESEDTEVHIAFGNVF